ncbi:S58 family peptidase [Agrobacterium larrymoorei]|uniref:P1 family peptidase n=1 Tax=Agrobacterium larrymoorei TaxID=160699 RepID=UPI001571CB7C|nr:P1 family peptidase [Agrobacterium larrymoorei]NTJ44540.1 S58 family peptidase [Agrobacterium larrymoorei]
MPKSRRPRLRDVGFVTSHFPTGALNAITDVKGVKIGHFTVVEGDSIRTGATAILPHDGNLFHDKVPAALSIYNGFGKFIGATQIEELGEIETPIVLTNTLGTGRAIEAINQYTLSQPGNESVVSINAVVGETNDSKLNDIRAGRPTTEEIKAALNDAQAGFVAEGCVGAGTGTVAFGMKGGIGTSSRIVRIAKQDYVLGILVQTNYGGKLLVAGKPFDNPLFHDKDGSIIIIVATDAPLSSRNLKRLGARAFGGLARTGAALSNGSGDYALAFSTAEEVRRTPERRKKLHAYAEISNDMISPLFEAAIEATEEAILNSLCAATDTTGFDAAKRKVWSVPSISIEALTAFFKT